MYRNAPGLIVGLSYAIQDNGTWETEIAKLPKYIQVSVEFTYIGDRLPSADQKHFDLPFVEEVVYEKESAPAVGAIADGSGVNTKVNFSSLKKLPDVGKSVRGAASLV